MSYNIELKNIRIEDYKEILRNQNILPGRRTLQESIDENFEKIHNCGINNLEELYKSLGTPPKLESFARKSGLSAEYLTILKREIGSFIQKPVPIADFPDLSPEMIEKFCENGIRTSKDLYEFSNGFRDVKLICNKFGIDEDQMRELFSLCDLVRINGVGAVFARILFTVGIYNIGELAEADAEDILQKFSEINSEKQYTKAKLGKKDMQFCINFARATVISPAIR